jgi:hypothetical protein
LKPVMNRNCSSSTVGAERCVAMKLRSEAADCALIAPADTASSRSFWLYMRIAPLFEGKLRSLYYSVNTAYLPGRGGIGGFFGPAAVLLRPIMPLDAVAAGK